MSTKELIKREIDKLPEDALGKVLDFIHRSHAPAWERTMGTFPRPIQI